VPRAYPVASCASSGHGQPVDAQVGSESLVVHALVSGDEDEDVAALFDPDDESLGQLLEPDSPSFGRLFGGGDDPVVDKPVGHPGLVEYPGRRGGGRLHRAESTGE
jgi:hypothetical protein